MADPLTNIAKTGLSTPATTRAGDMKKAVLDLFRERGKMTADQAAELLGETVLAVRPRVSELHQAGLLVDTGEKGRNASGSPVRVWAVSRRA